jgi:hypothetical protein
MAGKQKTEMRNEKKEYDSGSHLADFRLHVFAAEVDKFKESLGD